jgi:hypothetical protein
VPACRPGLLPNSQTLPSPISKHFPASSLGRGMYCVLAVIVEPKRALARAVMRRAGARLFISGRKQLFTNAPQAFVRRSYAESPGRAPMRRPGFFVWTAGPYNSTLASIQPDVRNGSLDYQQAKTGDIPGNLASGRACRAGTRRRTFGGDLAFPPNR